MSTFSERGHLSHVDSRLPDGRKWCHCNCSNAMSRLVEEMLLWQERRVQLMMPKGSGINADIRNQASAMQNNAKALQNGFWTTTRHKINYLKSSHFWQLPIIFSAWL